MTYRQILSKMNSHAALATVAWNNGNLFDYHIENARVELANAQMRRLDAQASAMYLAITQPTETES